MDHRRLLSLVLLVPALVLADQGGPVYMDTGTPGGACAGVRARLTASGAMYCCEADVWTACGSVQTAATATTLDGVWIGPTPPVDPVTYADWLTNGHVGHWGWINTSP